LNLGCLALLSLIFGCTKSPEKPLAETYPFDMASRVEVISYDFKPEDTENINNYKIVDGKLQIPSKKIIDRVVLNQKDIKELHSILYTDSCEEQSKADCYNPAHRLVFYDKKDRVFAYIELCLSCIDYRISADVVVPCGFCSAKAESLQYLFKEVGITHFSEF
ncbi:MAG: hypothetical protein V4581_10905, partial [Bacteroidota bacterium]